MRLKMSEMKGCPNNQQREASVLHPRGSPGNHHVHTTLKELFGSIWLTVALDTSLCRAVRPSRYPLIHAHLSGPKDHVTWGAYHYTTSFPAVTHTHNFPAFAVWMMGWNPHHLMSMHHMPISGKQQVLVTETSKQMNRRNDQQLTSAGTLRTKNNHFYIWLFPMPLVDLKWFHHATGRNITSYCLGQAPCRRGSEQLRRFSEVLHRHARTFESGEGDLPHAWRVGQCRHRPLYKAVAVAAMLPPTSMPPWSLTSYITHNQITSLSGLLTLWHWWQFLVHFQMCFGWRWQCWRCTTYAKDHNVSKDAIPCYEIACTAAFCACALSSGLSQAYLRSRRFVQQINRQCTSPCPANSSFSGHNINKKMDKCTFQLLAMLLFKAQDGIHAWGSQGVFSCLFTTNLDAVPIQRLNSRVQGYQSHHCQSCVLPDCACF